MSVNNPLCKWRSCATNVHELKNQGGANVEDAASALVANENYLGNHTDINEYVLQINEEQ